MNDLVSVIIPTYNRPEFLVQAIESVLCQTYPNIELIVVNDGSTDDTEEWLRPYMDRIKYIRKNNGGTASAVNAGLEEAKGKYIARLDDDDLFMPEKIEKQVKVFEENPDVGLVTSGCLLVDTSDRILVAEEPPDFSEYGPFVSLLLRYSLFQAAVMVRRECHEKVGIYRDTFAEDYDMFLRISKYWDVGTVNQPLAKYRRHPGNMTHNLSENEELLQEIKDFVCDILDSTQLEELFPLLASDPDPHRESCAYAAKGALYLRNDILDQAEENLTKALEVCPANPIPKIWLGILARSRGDLQSAIEYLSEINEDSELYHIARNAKDLVIAIQRSKDEDSALIRREVKREHEKLFKVNFDAISGRIAAEKPRRKTSSDELKLSRYAVIIDDYPIQGKHLIFNTFSHSMVSIGDELKEIINGFALGNVPTGKTEDVRMLEKMGILTSKKFDETQIARSWYKKFRSETSSIRVTILTTYACNFNCTYCVQEGVKKPVYMDDSCSDSLVQWLLDKIEEYKTKRMNLMFYGGEPLLNTGPILRISRKLQEFAVRNGIVLRSSITTNGSLIDSEMLEELTNYGLKSVKITLDGVKEVHDNRRPFKNGKGSFDVIVENMWHIPTDIELEVQANLDSENIDSFPQLLDFFERSRLKDRIDNLIVSPVVPSLGLNSTVREQRLNCMDSLDSYLSNQMDYMKRMVLEREFRSRVDAIDYTLCDMNRLGTTLIIDPLGDIYNCHSFVGREGFSIGDIYHSELKGIREILPDQMEECFQCTFFTVCGGGCRYKAYMLYGDDTKLFCEKEIVEHQIKELIKLRYAQKVKPRVTA